LPNLTPGRITAFAPISQPSSISTAATASTPTATAGRAYDEHRLAEESTSQPALCFQETTTDESRSG